MELIDVISDTDSNTVVVAAWLTDEWVVWARLVPPDYAVAELLVYAPEVETVGSQQVRSEPTYDELRRGWHRYRADQPIPDGGIPWRQLQRASIRQLQRWAREHVKAVGDVLSEAGADLAAWRRLARVAPEKRPRLTTEQRLVILAQEYLELLEAGEEAPNEVLGEKYGRSAGWVAGELYRARTHPHKVLTKPRTRGQAGGHLTERGKEVLTELTEKGTGR